MKPWQRRTFNALSAVVTLTGVLYFWMKYMLTTDDPFSVVNHPLQPLMLELHLIAAPALLVIFGIVFNAHVASKLKHPARLRRSGLTSLITFLTMSLSGYLLQVAVNEQVRLALLSLHVGTGLVFAVSYSVHLAAGFRLWRAQPANARSLG